MNQMQQPDASSQPANAVPMADADGCTYQAPGIPKIDPLKYRPGDEINKIRSGVRRGLLKAIPSGVACPVCGHRDAWCSCWDNNVAGNILCHRVASNVACKSGDGWIHIRGDQPIRPQAYKTVRIPINTSQYIAPPGLQAEYRRYWETMTRDILQAIADLLGVSSASLILLGAGLRLKDGQFPNGALVVPMYGPDRQLRGLKFRDLKTGEKKTNAGGHAGLYLPAKLQLNVVPLLVTEGASDAAAALTIGMPAMGRDSCTGQADLVKDFVAINKPTEGVVIVADRDEPGQRGARQLATALVSVTRKVRIVTPPVGIKDMRVWVAKGVTAAKMMELIHRTEPVRVAIG